MCEKSVAIIGSGLGGLACAVVLAKNGYRVTVLEQGAQAGGCLQCFWRGGVKFETGMHFIGSALEGQTLHKLMRYLGIDGKVRLSMLDASGYDVVSLAGQRYKFAMGREPFIRQMAEYFPAEEGNLRRYFSLVEHVSEGSTLHSLRVADTGGVIDAEYQLRSINEVIESIVSDPMLAEVLVGNLPLYAAERGKAPFSQHAFIMDFYNQSAFRFVGGCDQVANALIDVLRQHGGSVRLRSRVEHIELASDGSVAGVRLSSGERIVSDLVISDAHPKLTLSMFPAHALRPAYCRRVQAIPETIGGFSVYLRFRPGTVPYMNHNFYAYRTAHVWGCEHYDEATWPKGYLYMHFCHEPQPRYAVSGVILSYMDFADVARWADTHTPGHRGEAYEQFKTAKAEKLIDCLECEFPGIRQNITAYYTSTPLTYRDYTGSPLGSMYGIQKDVNNVAAYRVSHRTRVPGLLLTGQNINSHGMLGVLVGAIVTCGELLTSRRIFEQIQEANGEEEC